MRSKTISPLFIIGILFFIFGFVTWLGSVLIPYLRIACELNTFQSYFVAFAFYISYTVMAVPGSWLLKRTGFKRGMSLGLLVMALGALIFIPAAFMRQYPLFLSGLFVQGAGLTLLQTAANPYITILGPKQSAARRISIMGICNGIAGVLAPIILGSIILSDSDALQMKLASLDGVKRDFVLNSLASRVIIPYLVMMVLLLLLSFLIHWSGLPDVSEDDTGADPRAGISENKPIWNYPHLLLGVLTLFLYVGVEVIAVDTIPAYAESQGVSLSNAKFFASFTLLNMLAGYGIGILLIPRFLQQERALAISALSGLVFCLTALFLQGIPSVFFIALLGGANALIWPSIWPLAIDGLGPQTKTGSSLLIMAIGGGALLPLLYGHLAGRQGHRQAYWILIPCYLVILFYALYGHRIRSKTNK